MKPPPVHGEDTGDLLVIGWGSTRGVIEEAVDQLRAEGSRVSALHLRFLNPLPPGLKEIMGRFAAVMTVEGNWSDHPDDPIIDADNRRYSALAMLSALALSDRCRHLDLRWAANPELVGGAAMRRKLSQQ